MAARKPSKNVLAKERTSNTPNVRVKKGSEVVTTLQNFIAFNIHGRYNLSFSKATQKRLVAYGPWLAGVLVLFILPELLALAKTGTLISIISFFDTILFNQASWVILVIIFINIMLLVDGLSDVFNKKIRGWTRIYQATGLTTLYITWQLIRNLDQPAAPILSLVAALFILFTLFDIRKYYN